jgi:hypothetical protein
LANKLLDVLGEWQRLIKEFDFKAKDGIALAKAPCLPAVD